MNHSISVVLPNYNGRHLLEKNIPSLLSALDGLEHEIIIVDDCSNDDSVRFIEKNFPEIRLLVNEINLGFSATCNKGIRAARSELLCVVNTDVTFTPDYFTRLLPEFDDTSLFAVKGDIVNYDSTFDDVINIDRTTRLYYRRGFLRFDTGRPLTERTFISGNDEQFVCLGCCFVCSREMMSALEGYDEIYSPFYWEDCDLARRAMEYGYKLLYLPGARVYHQASSTISNYRSNTRRRLVSGRNKFIFTWNHLGKRQLLLSHFPVTFLNLLSRWIVLDWKYYASLYLAIARKLQHKQR